MNNGHVTADADTSEKQGGAVRISIEDDSHDSTHCFSKYPVIAIQVVYNFEWQHYTEKEI